MNNLKERNLVLNISPLHFYSPIKIITDKILVAFSDTVENYFVSYSILVKDNSIRYRAFFINSINYLPCKRIKYGFLKQNMLEQIPEINDFINESFVVEYETEVKTGIPEGKEIDIDFYFSKFGEIYNLTNLSNFCRDAILSGKSKTLIKVYQGYDLDYNRIKKDGINLSPSQLEKLVAKSEELNKPVKYCYKIQRYMFCVGQNKFELWNKHQFIEDGSTFFEKSFDKSSKDEYKEIGNLALNRETTSSINNNLPLLFSNTGENNERMTHYLDKDDFYESNEKFKVYQKDEQIILKCGKVKTLIGKTNIKDKKFISSLFSFSSILLNFFTNISIPNIVMSNVSENKMTMKIKKEDEIISYKYRIYKHQERKDEKQDYKIYHIVFDSQD